MDELNGLRWLKSSYSGGSGNGGGACVEAAGVAGGRAVRDSKDPSGPAFVFSAASWSAFIAGVKRGEFD